MWQKVKNLYHLIQAFLASIYFNFPSKKLTVIGVTGTDGKTTTSWMIYEILKNAGKKTSLISSTGALIGNETIDTGFHTTTPNPSQIQRYLRKAVNSGSKYFVLEATSHGLDQNRLAFIKFKVAVITNVTHEHLDYHKTQKRYLEAKAKLFKSVDFSILNFDDESYGFLKSQADGKIISYSPNSHADFNLKKLPLKLIIPGEYNLQNALAAAAATFSLGIEKTKILSSLNNFQGVVGRMDEIDLGQNFRVIIDFAHTPNALKEVFKTLKSQLNSSNSRLIAVFGSAGERDKAKRALMGKIAGRVADVSIITTEDPRRERVEDICKTIAGGLISEGKRQGKDYHIIYDRAKAIKFAVDLANDNDIVGLFGKAHEKSLCFGTKELPWNEFSQAEKAIRQKING